MRQLFTGFKETLFRIFLCNVAIPFTLFILIVKQFLYDVIAIVHRIVVIAKEKFVKQPL